MSLVLLTVTLIAVVGVLFASAENYSRQRDDLSCS